VSPLQDLSRSFLVCLDDSEGGSEILARQGYKRILFLIEGQSDMVLSHWKEPPAQDTIPPSRTSTVTLLLPGDGYEFSGDEYTTCRVVSPVEDFNIMSRDDAIRARAKLYHSCEDGETTVRLLESDRTEKFAKGWEFVYCLSGGIRVVMREQGRSETIHQDELNSKEMLWVEHENTGKDVLFDIKKNTENDAHFLVIILRQLSF